MTQTEVDKIVDEYVGILDKLIENINPSLSFSAASIYEHAAAVIPQLLARLVYKCSVGKLDSVLELALKICCSNAIQKFKGMNQLIKGVMRSYTESEQMERLDEILLFPIEENRFSGYVDPIQQISVSKKKKIKLPEKLYDKVMHEIKHVMSLEDPEQKEYACSRWIILYQIVELREEDKKQLLLILKEDVKKYREILYFLDPEDKWKNAKELFDNTISKLEQDAESPAFFSGGAQFGKVFSVFSELDSSDIEYQHVFEVLKKYVDKNGKWMSNQDHYEQQNRIRMSTLLFMQVFLKKADDSFSIEERAAALSLVKSIESVYHSPALDLFRADCLEKQDSSISLSVLDVKLWLSDKEDIELIKDYYFMLQRSDRSLTSFKNSYEFWNNAFCFGVYRMLGEELNLLEALKLCWSLLQFRIPENEELSLLTSALERLTDTTIISEEEEEQKALYKLWCRIKSCQIAHFLFQKECTDEAVLHWKKIGEDPNEFMEIRNIWS